MHQGKRKHNTLTLGSTSDEREIKTLFNNSLPGVWQTDKLFTPAFLQSLLTELQHVEAAKASTLASDGSMTNKSF